MPWPFSSTKNMEDTTLIRTKGRKIGRGHTINSGNQISNKNNGENEEHNNKKKNGSGDEKTRDLTNGLE